MAAKVDDWLAAQSDALDAMQANAFFVCLFVYSRLSNFSAILRLSPLPVTGLQI
jgi:hypothetical protein